MSKADQRRQAIEKALIRHGIDYSPPYVGRPKWRIHIWSGPIDASTSEAEWFCRGLDEVEPPSEGGAHGGDG